LTLEGANTSSRHYLYVMKKVRWKLWLNKRAFCLEAFSKKWGNFLVSGT